MKNWEKDLSDFYKEIEMEKQDKEERVEKKKPEVESFYLLKVVPAFKELKTELEKHGRKVGLYLEAIDIGTASILVRFKGKEEYSYTMRVEISQDRAFPYPIIVFTKKDGKSYSSEQRIRHGRHDISDISKKDIIQHFLGQYKLHLSGKI